MSRSDSLEVTRLFVYGLLRRDDRGWYLMEGLPWLGECRTAPGFRLLACEGGEFPGLVHDRQGQGQVVGELLEVVQPERIAAMDEYEGTAEGIYRRELIELEDGSRAWAYLYTAPDRDQLENAGLDWQKSPLRLSAQEVERRAALPEDQRGGWKPPAH